jgi:hypothetical protein
MPRIPHRLDNWLTYVGEVVSLMHQPPLTPWYSFLLEGESTPMATVLLKRTQKPNNLRNRTRDLPACRTLPQTTMLPHALRLRVNCYYFLIININCICHLKTISNI